LAAVDKTMSTQAKTLAAVDKTMSTQAKTLAAVGETLAEIVDKDAFDKISMSSEPRKIKKEDFARSYGVTVESLRCMISDTSLGSIVAAAPSSPTPKNPVTLSHLLPRGASNAEKVSLGYGNSDIDSIRNTILLCKGIEEAFDHKFLSFVPSEKPFSDNKYKLHIWVDNIKDNPIYEGASVTIGSFEGAPLKLQVGGASHNPFRRALSYQAYRAWKTWSRSLDELPEDSDTSVYRGSYQSTRQRYIQQIARDAELDAEDEDDFADRQVAEGNEENDG
jgi:hypothetical protein